MFVTEQIVGAYTQHQESSRLPAPHKHMREPIHCRWVEHHGPEISDLRPGGEPFADRNLAAANANVYETFRKVLRSA